MVELAKAAVAVPSTNRYVLITLQVVGLTAKMIRGALGAQEELGVRYPGGNVP